jgi:hypothetical protein
MAGTAEAASHGDKKMNPCEVKAKSKEMMKKQGENPCAQNPCGKTANPCDAKAKAKGMMEKGEKKMMDKTKTN